MVAQVSFRYMEIDDASILLHLLKANIVRSQIVGDAFCLLHTVRKLYDHLTDGLSLDLLRVGEEDIERCVQVYRELICLYEDMI